VKYGNVKNLFKENLVALLNGSKKCRLKMMLNEARDLK
jgi:hypothetical protein